MERTIEIQRVHWIRRARLICQIREQLKLNLEIEWLKLDSLNLKKVLNENREPSKAQLGHSLQSEESLKDKKVGNERFFE